jgi:sucrose-6-phosphate hydrolase SacC (GH32 family)
VITPKFLVVVLIIFFVGLGFFYLYRELSIFISNPRLAITEPLDNFTTEENTIKVEGITEKDVKLFINDQSTVVNEDGKFSEVLVIQPGINTIAIKAINRFDKESEKIITVESKFQNIQEESGSSEEQPPSEEQVQAEEEKKKVQVDVYGDTKAVSITVKTDDSVAFTGEINPGETKSFEAEEKISISAEKGKYAGVIVNGKNIGTLSKDTKPASRIFTAE